MRVLSMLQLLPLLAGLVDPMWVESSYWKYDLVFLFCVESRKGVGGTSRWLTDVWFSCIVCWLLVLGDVLRICKLDKSVSNDRLFWSVHHILGMMGNQFSWCEQGDGSGGCGLFLAGRECLCVFLEGCLWGQRTCWMAWWGRVVGGAFCVLWRWSRL